MRECGFASPTLNMLIKNAGLFLNVYLWTNPQEKTFTSFFKSQQLNIKHGTAGTESLEIMGLF